MSRMVKGDKPFQILSDAFALSPSSTGYVLEYSADGKNYTAWDERVPANENLVVNGVANGMYFRCNGNSDELVLQYDAK